MTPVLLSLPGGERLAARLQRSVQGADGALTLHRFPDGEVRVRIVGDVAGREVVLVGSLDRPDEKLLPLLFAAATAAELGARAVGLVAPYLPYLRQDTAFRPGEAVSAALRAAALERARLAGDGGSSPPRVLDLNELFTIPTEVVHSAPSIAAWIRGRIPRPVIIGPDEESERWVVEVAARVEAPWVLMTKRRRGDHAVELTLPTVSGLQGR